MSQASKVSEKTPEILVIQIGSGVESFRSTFEILTRMRDWPRIPHLLTGNRLDVVTSLQHNKPQLLILGTLELTTTDGVAAFVREARKCNPKLRVVWLSSFQPPQGCHFDRVVSKSMESHPEIIYQLMRRFTAGEPWPEHVVAGLPETPVELAV